MSAGEAASRPPRRPARLREEQRRVYAQNGWMMSESVRRFEAWLLREAVKLAGGDVKRARELADRALQRLVELDVTRFDDGDRDYLEAELRRELRRAMRPRQRVARNARIRREEK